MTVKQRLLWMAIGGGLVFALVCASCAGFFVIAASMGATSELSVGPAVGVIRIDGVIVSGDPPVDPFGTPSGAYSGLIVDHLKQADEDVNVKAIVLRVNSPGGSVVGSDEIYQQVLVMSKPVVVSMGELAASGGYYVSAPADVIFANPGTLTGSIGVISQFINIGDLLEEHGVEVTTIKSGEFKDIGSLFRAMSDEEKESWQAIIDETYEEFVQIVADGREMPIEEVRQLADGSIYTGRQALELGMIDQLGNLPAAIQHAAELGGIEGEPRIVEYEMPFSIFEGLLGMTRPADPLSEVMILLDRAHGPVLHYLYVGPWKN
jgi:protease-4